LFFIYLPPTIKYLTVFLRGKLPKLPKTITQLEIIGMGFFSFVPGDVPETIIHLKLPFLNYSMPEKNFVPNSVKTLDFGNNVDLIIRSEMIPDTVSHLIFPKKYSHSISKECYPKSLSELTVGRTFKDLNPDGTFLYNKKVKINFI
jgi:hypothetical protein